jgi:DNA-binding LacI/PurR family transcriptional regulator
VVVIGRPVSSAGVDVVRAADDEGVATAVEFVAGLGHRRIVHVDGGSGTISDLRRGGYEAAMRRLGLAEALRVIPGGLTEDSGARAAQTVLGSHPRPTAIIAFNDRSAMGLLDTLIRAGVDVPGDVSVVGYDNSTVSRLAHIDLTTVDQNTHELTESAVAALIERLDDGRTDHREVVLHPSLVVRGTTGPPPT